MTLSATPIPRTLQLALTGVRELSIIATPPVDRLAVRTFISPFERFARAGSAAARTLSRRPELLCRARASTISRRLASLPSPACSGGEIHCLAHGQLGGNATGSPRMAAFYGVPIWTCCCRPSIVEFGLDIPVRQYAHRASRRYVRSWPALSIARPGRPLESLALMRFFTVPQNRTLTPQAERRLKVLHSLDTARGRVRGSRAMISIFRGAGNLLGDEQLGHIKEVGYELYQDNAASRRSRLLKCGAFSRSPPRRPGRLRSRLAQQLRIPETYVEDLHLTHEPLSASCAALQPSEEIESFAAEMIDRFGPLPGEVEQLLQLVADQGLVPQGAYRKGRRGAERGGHRCV